MNTYDALHRRVAKQVWQNLPMAGWTCLKTITFTYDGWNVIEEKELDGSAGPPARHHRYTWGADLSGTLQGAGGVGGLLMAEELSTLNQPLSTPVAHYYWYDGNGNVAGLMNDTGLVEATHRYTSFGGDLETYLANPGTFASRNPWRFSTKYLDREVETTEGLYYYGYRHYLTALGRWTARDPIGERGGMNLYGMVGNMLTSGIDRFGLSPEFPDCCKAEEDALKEAEDELGDEQSDYAYALVGVTATALNLVRQASAFSAASDAAMGVCALAISTQSPPHLAACAAATALVTKTYYDVLGATAAAGAAAIYATNVKDRVDRKQSKVEEKTKALEDCQNKMDDRCRPCPINKNGNGQGPVPFT